MSQQVSAGQVLLDSSIFMDINIQNDIPFISLEKILAVQLNQLTFRNITIQQNTYSSILVIDSCNQINISKSSFISNSNQKGKGGSIQAIDNQFIEIENSQFSQNKCLSLNGGALFISNSVFQAQVIIKNSLFNFNTAIYSTGGAIHLENSNLKMYNTSIFSNEAAIGGGVFYQQIIPDFILDFQKGIVYNNKIINNKATIFGKNFGSALRKIKISLDDIKVNNQSLIIKNNSLEEVIQLKSGNQISFQRIQILDEENNPVIIPNSNEPYLTKYCSSVQALIQEVGISVEWDQSSTVLKLVSNTISELQDSKQQVYFKQGKLELEIKIQFLGCSVGDILTHQEKSLICEQCPDGKYSLNLNDTTCQQCPDSAVKCIGSNIYLRNGYWRENEYTDNIVYCDFNPNSCQAESNLSKMNCIQGYKGPICKSCDIYGDVWEYRYSQLFDEGNCYRCSQNVLYIVLQNLAIFLFASCYIFGILKKIISSLQAKLAGYFINKADIIYLGTTLTDKDKSQIVSKILTDHLQMLSLLNTIQISIPSFFKASIGLSGNPLRVTSKSFDCIFSQFPNLQPLWFYQTIWSFSLPATLFITYLIFGVLIYYLYVFLFFPYGDNNLNQINKLLKDWKQKLLRH
ncbi:transmembrane protein, putative (macronuclear) [Tetrahymena thermophila SB210]|uniref:Transmembrane protein, putative n=1 Tax=Tetrahymena thermophila (strain SB210) TaxID=312017 RepID=Q23TU9_TETTS|nr:transmembrane protein, putative [Tetrahymena thermophila SB210]EAR99946.2 transmembrane protein, putative [Tetrahymena thermophila SB210]|eukprot:XP_001020191.2 transmembrane protein, putative [Tetrahymena thermophila SB210]